MASATMPPAGRPGGAVQLGVDALVRAAILSYESPGEPFDDGADPRRAEPFVEFAPTDDADAS